MRCSLEQTNGIPGILTIYSDSGDLMETRSRKDRSPFSITERLKTMLETTFDDGSLCSRIDEERSQLR